MHGISFKRGNMVDWNKMRAALMGGAGIYLIYTAYSIFQGRLDADSTMPLWQNYVFSLLFALASVAVFAYAYVLWKRAKKSAKELDEAIERERAAEQVAAAQNASGADTADKSGREEGTAGL